MSTIINIQTKLEFSDHDLQNLFVTALEGGINYWAICRNVKRLELDNGDDWIYTSVEVADEEELAQEDYDHSKVKWDKVTMQTMALGIERYLEKYPERRLAKELIAMGSGMQCFDYDADDADVILQLGVFGEIVYG